MTDCIFPKTNSNTLSAADVDVLYMVREGLIDLSAEQTTANNCLYKVRRDKMLRTIGTSNMGCHCGTSLATSTSIHVDNSMSNGCNSCSALCCCVMLSQGNGTATAFTDTCCVYQNASYPDLCVCVHADVCAGSTRVCYYRSILASSSVCDIAPQNYDEVYIVFRGSGGFAGATNKVATSQLITFGSASGWSAATSVPYTCCEMCLKWKKVSGNTYDIYCNGTCLCQVADITTYCLCAYTGAENGCSSGSSDASMTLYIKRLCSAAQASATCITTCNFAHCICPKTIYVGGLKTGTGCVVYNVYDAANDCTLASAKPFNSATCLCGNQCAQCLRVQLIQCTNAVSKIEKWGYVIE